MPSPENREKALESALAQIDRQFGKGSVMRLGSDERAPVEVIPTGSIALDVALGSSARDQLEVREHANIDSVGRYPDQPQNAISIRTQEHQYIVCRLSNERNRLVGVGQK